MPRNKQNPKFTVYNYEKHWGFFCSAMKNNSFNAVNTSTIFCYLAQWNSYLMFSNAFLIFFTLELRFYSKQKNVLITSFTPEFMFCFKKKIFLSATHSCLFSIHRMIAPSLQFLSAEITSQLYKQNGNIFQVIPQPCISFVEKVCSVLQTTKSAFRYTCTLESPVPPPNCNITYDELEICAQFSANNLDFYFIKDPGTELCDTISVIDQNVHGKQSL